MLSEAEERVKAVEKNRMRNILSVICFLLFSCSSAFSINEVESSLLVHKATTQIDDQLYIGINFKIAPDWHIYWKYPGDAGLPTRVKWDTPKGVTVSELLWPAPETFSQNESMVGYGYSNETVLLAKVTIPEGQSIGNISGQVNWLGCSKSLCVPGKSTLTIPVSDLINPKEQNSKDLSFWIKQLPQAEHGEVFTEEIKVTRSGVNSSANLVLTWQIAPLKVEWYPELGQFLALKDLKIINKDTTTILAFDLEHLSGSKAEILNSTAVAHFNNGDKRSFNLPIDLVN